MNRYCRIPAFCLLIRGILSGAPNEIPGWLPERSPIPFVPDGARWIARPSPLAGQGWARTASFRGVARIPRPVRRAIWVAAPFQTLRVYVNGTLVGTAHHEREAAPLVVDVTDRLVPGTNELTALVHCVWRPAFYAQLRVEYADGEFRDTITDGSWECAPGGAADGIGPAPREANWTSCAETGRYDPKPGEGPWGHGFALLPRDRLQRRIGPHNRRLKEEWEAGSVAVGPVFAGAYAKPAYEARFKDFLRLDRQSGQLLDPDGNPRHLFFTIYNQARKGRTVLDVADFDFDRLEQDLELMERARVNLYLRKLGWGRLLDEQGRWARIEKQPEGTGLPEFTYEYEVLEYLLDRAQSHGLYVVVEGDFYWSVNHAVVPPAYLTRAYLYPEILEAQALATRKIMRRLSSRKNLLAIMIGEEEIILNPDLSNPDLRREFAAFLREKYGSIERLREAWTHGYDYMDRSGFAEQTHRAEYWEDSPAERVLSPRFTYARGAFDQLKDWSEVPLPLWPRYRSPAAPAIPLHGHKSYNNFTPDDPVWIDYYELREDKLLFGMLRRWATTVKEACPNQLLFYSNAQDFTNSWHFLHFFRRAEIPFDVIGVGCHDSGKNLSEIPPWARMRKAIKVVSSYRPYVSARGALPGGIAPGEGEGGRADSPQEVLDYYRGALFDEIGGGCAWSQTYSWLHMSGGDGGTPPRMTPLLTWMSAFMPVVEKARFSLRRPVHILVVRNRNLQHSNRSGLDYGNARSVASILGQSNVEFDIAMDQDLCYGGKEDFRIDLANYRLVILPTVAIDYPDPVWNVLDAWLADPEYAGKRSLVIGRIGKKSPYLAPRHEFHPMLQRWLGVKDYAGSVSLRGKQRFKAARTIGRVPAGGTIEFDMGPADPTGTWTASEPLLQSSRPGGETVAMTTLYAGNRIRAFGFNLGLAYNDLWGMEPTQSAYDALAPVFADAVDAGRIDRPVRAPHHVRVYVSDDADLVLVRERFGIATQVPCEIRLGRPGRFSGCRTERLPDGYTRFHAKLQPYASLYFRRIGGGEGLE